MDGAPIYLFDGHCVLCSRAVHYVLKYEKTPDMLFIAITSEKGRSLALEYGIDPDAPESFLYIEDEITYEKSAAALKIIARTGGPARVFLLGYILPRPVRDFIYDRIAKNRYRIFGRTEHCFIPGPEMQSRFIMR